MKENFSNLARYIGDYRRSVENPEAYWDEIASTFLWHQRWEKTLEWDFRKPEVKWFIGGKLNITENCLDRHLVTKANKVAIIWESNFVDEPSQYITYQELYESVCQFANVLKNNGIQKGDRVCIYMPMVPSLAVAVLACARIGAVHSVVFAGFSASSLVDRIQDAEAKMVVTADGAYRGNKTIDLKGVVDEALSKCPTVEKVIVYERTKTPITMQKGRDVWWHDEMAKASKACKAEVMDSEDMLFILYTSGSTGKPKGMVHTCGGYMVYTGHTFRYVFRYKEGEIYWCTADIGWITGHSYILYGPLANGATTLMFEGVPSYPDMGRFWQIVEKHKVNIFYTAPTAIRSLQQAPLELVHRHDLSSLRCLGTVGEPINAEAWHWYSDNIGKNKCPIVDTWWQTETGGIMIAPVAGVTPTKPTYATLPLPGIQPVLVDERGRIIEGNAVEGNLCIKFPWPSMARTIYKNHARFKDTYFAAFDGLYFTGDGCRRDYEGYYRITGRVDDIIIVSGHNLGTAEIENAINAHPSVCESAVIGYPHAIKGNAIYAYCVCYQKPNPEEEEELRKEILQVVSRTIGPIAKPEKIQFVSGLPKTRSGKIMRRILRKVAEGALNQLGDTSTLLNPEVVEEIIAGRLS